MKFVLCSHRNASKIPRIFAGNFAHLIARNFVEANFRRIEISTKICAKLNEISAKFRKIDDAKFRTNEKQQ